jgi:lantibiotic biosynthesis protein
MTDYKVQPFSSFVLRTPLLPLSFYYNLLENYTPETVLQLVENPLIREGIRLASPELLATLDQYQLNPLSLSGKKKESLAFSVLKYVARISSRCTPFGIFAGCTVGDIDFETNIILDIPENFVRYTQFDMQFWVALLQEFANRKTVRPYLIYYPNNSVYGLGDFYRFVEYHYVKTNREHSISAFRKTQLLDDLLLHTQSGVTVNEMVDLIADDASEHEEALEYIHQLIDFQFLVSELDATVTGNDEWKRVLGVLGKIPELQKEYAVLEKIKKQLLDLDNTLLPTESKYEDLKNEIQKLGVQYDTKYLFQTDLNTQTTANQLSQKVSEKVLQALRFLNGIQKRKPNSAQTEFIKAFTERYETREMPLTTVLDTENGIGYLQDSEMNDTHDILERFTFKNKITASEKGFWTGLDFILEKKLQECIQKNEQIIVLTVKDFPHFDSKWDDAPATFSVLIELLEEEQIVLCSSGNSSATKLLGRFCIGNKAIHNFTKKIIEKETAYHSDKILSEIVHIPESRTGNILRRPALRKYEIAYLAQSGVTTKDTIAVTDLMIVIKNNQIVLRSQKHNAVVLPCLSNAHNYGNQLSLPIYHFLCDLQSQEIKPIHSFNWGVLESHYNYFPRVVYKGVILSKAKWMVSKNEIEAFTKTTNSDLFQAFTNWRLERKLPQFVNWVNFDNTLLLDFDKEIGVALFLKSVQNRKDCILEEFLFANESVVRDLKNEGFSNQIILSFYKESLQ